MNKKPYYHQSAIVFLLIGMIFLMNAIAVLVETNWIFYIVSALAIATLIYAIVSSFIIEKTNKQ